MAQAATWSVPLAADAPVTPSTMATRTDQSFDALLSLHSGGARPSYAVAGTMWYNTTSALALLYDGTDDLNVVILAATPPSASTDTGVAGQWATDGSYIYVCTATDTWVRAALATW